nr:RNA-directed DNA polymerase, eukaryota [Tanacetum cinerariifolium]
MNIISLNIQGLGHKTKKEWVKELNLKHKVNFLALQETKIDRITHMDVKCIWGNFNYNFVTSDSFGNSGGILCIWEYNVFTKDHVTISDNFMAIYGLWNSNKSLVLFVVVYAPQSIALKRVLWEYISLLISRWDGETIVMGDFNEVRSSDERLGSVFNLSSARAFNSFISVSGLVDVKMEGYSFTWSHPSASKMNKNLSDHRHILLREVFSDFGPTRFRIYHSWFRRVGFDAMVEMAWTSFLHSDSNLLVRFKKKLQALKFIIRGWIKDKHLNQSGVTRSIKEELIAIDKMFDSENASDVLRLKRLDLNRQLNDIKSLESSDWLQKSKIKWAVEGDENSNFFHGIINKKRSQLSIRGVLVDGQWKTDPDVVKDAFKDHFSNRFKHPQQSRFKLNFAFPNRLSNDQVVDLDRYISHDEIRAAVWNCGVNKSPSPNGYSLEFFRRYWRFISPDFCSAVAQFLDTGQFPSGCNASFIALIPKVVDAKVIHEPLKVSHLFYVDDAIFIGEWSQSNMVNIVKILNCFYLASGLKINIQKSQLLGVGVHRDLVYQAAGFIGCSVMQTSFRYLGVMVGDCMTRKYAWSDIVQKLHSRLSKWKVNTLSIGGRLTLLKSVLGASPLYHMSLYKVPKGILHEMEMIRSNFFKGAAHSERKISWVSWGKVLASKKYGEASVATKLVSPSIDESFRRPVRDGAERFQWRDLCEIIDYVTFSSSKDKWVCDLSGDGEFRVKEVRFKLDYIFLPSVIPIKINIFVWHAGLDRLPTRGNLIRRGVVLDSDICPMCNMVYEDISHVLFRCNMAGHIFRLLCRWSNSCWNEFFMSLGGTCGCSGISLFSMLLLRDSPWFLTILFLVPSYGVLIDVMVLFLGNLG